MIIVYQAVVSSVSIASYFHGFWLFFHAWDCPVDADLNICALQKWCGDQDDIEDDVGDYIHENETEDQYDWTDFGIDSDDVMTPLFSYPVNGSGT